MGVPDVGTGAAITFASGYFGEITGFSMDGMERPSIDTTHLGTTNARTFIPGDLYDPGELAVELQFDTQTLPPFSATAETVTVTFPLTSGGTTTTWAASGFLTSFNYDVPLEDLNTASATVKLSGQVTVTTN